MGAPQSAQTHLVVADDLAGVARYGAELFVRLARAAAPRGRFSVALAGGSTPRALHALLAAPPLRDEVDWATVRFYWGDDRCVAPDAPESNYRMARETLLDKLPINPTQVHRIKTELANPAEAAALYEQKLRDEFNVPPGQLPRFDLVYLGMGDDGHTASLFPQTAALAVTDRLVVANYVPKLGVNRVTLTAPVLNNSTQVAFLVAGPDKATALAAVLEGPRDPDRYPSQMIAPANGELWWFADRAATADLTAAHP